MIRVLFVDDEMIVRVALKSMVQWEETEFEVVGAVADGNAALEAVRLHDPQIVVTDLKMPGLDGLGLCRELAARGYRGRIIVLSSYGEFDLAREAMRYGCVDYLLKANFTDAQLLESLRKAAAALPADPPAAPERRPDDRFDAAELRDMLLRPDNQPRVRDFASAYLALYMVKREAFLQGIALADGPSAEMLSSVAGECVGGAAQICALTPARALLLYPAGDAGEARRDAARINANLQIYMNTRAAFVLSGPLQSNAQLQLALRACEATAQLTLYRGFDSVLDQDEGAAYSRELGEEAFLAVDRVVEALTMSDYARAQEIAFAALDGFDGGRIAVNSARRFIRTLFERVTVAYSFYFENNKDKLGAIALRYKECAWIGEYKAAVADIIDEISVSLVKLDETKVGRNVQDIVAYVKANIDRRITLGGISAAVNMSESYISRLFKNETGMNLMSYVNMLKMERAMELLRDPDIIVKEAAHRLGYDDQSYFNRIFNKYFGVSPVEFKRNYQNSLNPGKNNPN